MLIEPHIAKVIKDGYAETQRKDCDNPTKHAEKVKDELPSGNNFVGHKEFQRHATQRNQQDGKQYQNSNDNQHEDGKDPLDNPSFYCQALVGHIVGIYVSESVEDSHDSAGAEHQAQEDTDGKQPVVGLVHDAIDGFGHIIKGSRRNEEVLDEHDHPFVKMGNRDVGNQGEEEQQQREERHKEVEGHTCRTVDGTTFGKQLDEIGTWPALSLKLVKKSL